MKLYFSNKDFTKGLYFLLQIYCSGMHLENPKEYLTLVKGEADNFSEVYGYRYKSGSVTL